MGQVFIANPKGGCGKTTLSTQLAAYYANQGKRVLLLDHDAQKSSSDWIGCRPEKSAFIASKGARLDESLELKGDFDIVVHDMPAAWSLDHVSEIIHGEDHVIIPVLASPNDIKACLRFIMSLNRSGVLESGVQVGLVGNRYRSFTSYAKVLEAFLQRVELPLIANIRDSQNYVRAMDKGLSIFDFPPSRVQRDLDQWQPIIDWLPFR